MRSRIKLVMTGILLVGMASSVWVLRRKHNAHPGAGAGASEVTAAASGAGAGEDGAGEPAAEGWRVGHRYAQRLSFVAKVGQADGAAQPVETAIQVDGDWTSTVVDGRGALADVEVTLSDLRVRGGEEDAGTTMRDELQRPFIVSYERDGRARSISFSTPPRPFTQNIVKELVATFQFVGPRPGSQWTTMEMSPTGEALMSYARREDGTFERKRVKYVRVAGRNGLQPAESATVVPQVESSEGAFTLDALGRVAGATVKERVLAVTPQIDAKFRATMESTLTLVSHTFDATLARPGAVAGLTTVDLLTSREAYADADTESLRQVVKDARLPELRADLAKARGAQDAQATVDAQYRLSALLRLEPKAVGELRDELRSKSLDPALLGALATAGTTEAQAALVSVAKDAQMPNNLRQAAVEATQIVEQPTDETFKDVEALAASDEPGMRKSASYAMGTLTKKLGEADPQAASDRIKQLEADFDQATSDDERIRLLDTLGNTASAEALSALRKGLAMANPLVRVAAVNALRNIPDAGADALIAAALTTDTDERVKEAGLFAATFRRFPALAPAFQRIMATEADAGFRGKALNVIVTYLDRDGAIDTIPLLEQVVSNDKDEDVRKGAEKALQRRKG